MAEERRKQYPFDKFEPKWQAFWEENKTFRALNPGDAGFDPAQPKFYVLDMFPYPSGTGLHVGHPVGYLATDILARYKRTRGFNVLHPMGWDAFGLPAEQYAIKTGQHPAITTAQNIGKFKGQLKRIGLGYDWEREINTTDPAYFKWTQWIFLKLYNSWFNPATNKAGPISTYTGDDPNSARLAYVSEAPVNWCPTLGTVLANEEVIDGKSEVGGFPVERRPMRQWMLRITAFCQRLIDELDGLEWPESIRLLQRNWIGRSEGAEVDFKIADSEEIIRVFTTRPDTLFGATYMVLAPEHRLVDEISSEEQMPAIEEYRAKTARKSDLERTELAKEKSGVFTGGYAINPVNGERMPIWIADYVLLGYGTGAIMAVPAHDERDFEFATKFNLPIKPVVGLLEPKVFQFNPDRGGYSEGAPEMSVLEIDGEKKDVFVFRRSPISENGVAVNSQFLDGLPTDAAKKKITDWLESKGIGKRSINFKLRDWLFSRQRYWGEPFPIVWRDGKHEALPESELPVVPPPMDDFKPTGTAEPPLSKLTDWIRYSDTATRETNTMPQWAGSCWYYLRFIDPRNGERFVGKNAERYWMTGKCPVLSAQCSVVEKEKLSTDAPSTEHLHENRGGVDLYVGGTEHAVLHLLYARFWHKVLFDLGYVSTPEPFQRLVNQGLMLGEDSQKMSKSRGNVVNPDDVIEQYGADALRCYEMFMGPLEATKPWSMTGVEGVYRFLARVWRLVMAEQQDGSWSLSPLVQDIEPTGAQLRVIHATVKKVTEDIEALAFNTAISHMMIFVNAFVNAPARPLSALRVLLQLLNPFAPHLTEELWEILRGKFAGFDASLSKHPWPAWDEKYLIDDEVEIPVQVNGKLRDKIVVKKDATPAEVEKIALAAPKIQEHIASKTVRKIVVVPGKLANIVAS